MDENKIDYNSMYPTLLKDKKPNKDDCKTWQVVITCVNTNWASYDEEKWFKSLSECTRFVNSFKPKRGYKVDSIRFDDQVMLL